MVELEVHCGRSDVSTRDTPLYYAKLMLVCEIEEERKSDGACWKDSKVMQ